MYNGNKLAFSFYSAHDGVRKVVEITEEDYKQFATEWEECKNRVHGINTLDSYIELVFSFNY